MGRSICHGLPSSVSKTIGGLHGHTHADDRRLVNRARGGDRDALEQLVQRHQAWVYDVAVRMLVHPHDAEDATQEIFIKALTRLSAFARPKRLSNVALPDRREPRHQYEAWPPGARPATPIGEVVLLHRSLDRDILDRLRGPVFRCLA